MRGNALLTAAILLAPLGLFAAGCRGGPPPPVAVHTPLSSREPAGIPPSRQPSIAGDVLIYPCQWRNAEELGARLYALLYPKYGPYLRIVPDPNQNALLIYLPPRESRLKGPVTETY
jgi:hypothetical protein